MKGVVPGPQPEPKRPASLPPGLPSRSPVAVIDAWPSMPCPRLPSLLSPNGCVCSSAHLHQRPPPGRPLSSSRPPRTKLVTPGDSAWRAAPPGTGCHPSVCRREVTPPQVSPCCQALFLAVAPHSHRCPGLNLPGGLALPLPPPPTSNRAQNLVIPSLKRVSYSFFPVNSYCRQPRPDLGQLCSHRGSCPASGSSGLPANYL